MRTVPGKAHINTAGEGRASGAPVRRARSSRRSSRASRAVGSTYTVLPKSGYALMLFVLVLLSISRIHQHFGFLAALRPALVLVIAAFGLAFLAPSGLAYRNLRSPPAKLMLAIVGMACISVPFGISMGGSARFLLDTYFKVILAYVLVMLALRGPREIYQFTWAWVLACGILTWMATFVFRLGSAGGVRRLGGLYTYDSNDLGLVLIIGIPLTIALFEVSGRYGRSVCAGILLLTGLSLARSGSRGAFVGLIVVGAAFLWQASHIQVRHRLTAVAVIAAALIAAAPFGYWEQIESLTRPTEDYNWEAETGRRMIALRGLSYMAERPLSGLGVSNFPKAEWTISEMAQDEFRERGIKGSAAHNTWLQAAAEMGVPGLILWVMFVFGTMFTVGREGRRLPPSWRRGDPEQQVLFASARYLPLSILGFATTSLFVSFAYLDPMYYLAAMSAAVLVSIRRKKALLERRRVARPPV